MGGPDAFEATIEDGGALVHVHDPGAFVLGVVALVHLDKQEEITLWTSVEGNGSIHDRNATWDTRLTMGIASTILRQVYAVDVRMMFALPTLTPRPPTKKNKKGHLQTGVFDAGRNTN